MKNWKSKISSLFKSKSKKAPEEDNDLYEDEYDEGYQGEYEGEYEDDGHAELEEITYNEDSTSPGTPLEEELLARPQDEDLEYPEEEIDGEYQEEYDDNFDDEDNPPTFETLTVNQVRENQGEVQYQDQDDLPPSPSDREEDSTNPSLFNSEEGIDEDEDDFEHTTPSLREFSLKEKGKKGQLLAKLKSLTKKPLSKKARFPGADGNSSNFTSKLGDKLSQINFDEIFEKIYSPQSRRRIHFIFLFLLFTGLSVKTADIITAFVSPKLEDYKITLAVAPAGVNERDIIKNSLAQMEGNDLFQAPREGEKKIIQPVKEEKAICLNADKKSSLSVKLLSTVVLKDEVKSLASVQMRKSKVAEYLRKGDKISGVLEVGRIASQKLFFKNLQSRECEYIEGEEDKRKKKSKGTLNIVREPKKAKKILSDAKETGISNVGNTFKIKKAVRSKMLANISEVLTQARAVQIKKPDGSLEFKMQEIVPGSIYSQLNIENGDIVSGINGEKIKNVSELMNLFGQIDKIDHFELSVKKKGIEQTLQYDFE